LSVVLDVDAHDEAKTVGRATSHGLSMHPQTRPKFRSSGFAPKQMRSRGTVHIWLAVGPRFWSPRTCGTHMVRLRTHVPERNMQGHFAK
jgi:hypothetical protein